MCPIDYLLLYYHHLHESTWPTFQPLVHRLRLRQNRAGMLQRGETQGRRDGPCTSDEAIARLPHANGAPVLAMRAPLILSCSSRDLVLGHGASSETVSQTRRCEHCTECSARV
jgi:hypothetical protein